jgi:hypothetical protein
MNPGIYELTDEQYHADPCSETSLSSGIVKLLVNESPRHAWHVHPRLNPNYQSEENIKFDFGTVAHALVLQGIDRMEIVDAADWRTKAAKEQRDDARGRGMVPLLKHQADSALAMVGAFREAMANCPDLSGITLAEGKAEQSIIWREQYMDGQHTWMRAKPDWRSNDGTLIIDYKTTSGSAEPEAAVRQIMGQMDGDIQAAFYTRGNKAICGLDAQFVFAVQETKAPYAVSFIGVSPTYMALGEDKCRVGISLFSECMKRNEWPGYERRINWAEPKAWQFSAWAEKQNMEAAHGDQDA